MMQSFEEYAASFEEYAAWCRSRVPPVDHGECPASKHKTELATGNEEPCPVTLRTVYSDHVVVTPRPQGSR